MRPFPALALALLLLPVPSALAAEVELAADDGTALHGTYEQQEGTDKGVLFVHGKDRQSSDWKFLANRLNTSGFTSLAIDLRGHGTNVAEGQPKPELSEEDYQAMLGDVQAGIAFLKEKGIAQVVLVGADLGANLALLAASQDESIVNVVMLSPALKYKGVRADGAIRAYGTRPVLMVVSNDDPYSAKSGLLLEAEAQGTKHLEIYTAAGRGATMLNREPALEGLIQSWLLGSHAVVTGEAQIEGPQIEGSGEKMETTGPLLPGQ